MYTNQTMPDFGLDSFPPILKTYFLFESYLEYKDRSLVSFSDCFLTRLAQSVDARDNKFN